MMKLLGFNLLAFCLIWVVVEASPFLDYSPASTPPKINNFYNDVRILKYENDVGLGNYKYGYEQSDGTRAEQVGQIRNQGTKDEILAVNGQFRWVSPGGIAYIVRYTADEEGYKPKIEQETLLPPRKVTQFSSDQQISYAPPTTHYAASLIG